MSQVFVRSALVSLVVLSGLPALAQSRPGGGNAGPAIRQAPVVNRANRGSYPQPAEGQPASRGPESLRGGELPAAPQPLGPTQEQRGGERSQPQQNQALQQQPQRQFQQPQPPREYSQGPSQTRPAPQDFGRGRNDGGYNGGNVGQPRGDYGRGDLNRGEQFNRGSGPIAVPNGRGPGIGGRPGDFGRGGPGQFGRGGYGRPFPPQRGYPQTPIFGQPNDGSDQGYDQGYGQGYGQVNFDQSIIPGLNNVYRFFNGQEHFLTLNAQEGFQAGYQVEGLAFRTFADPANGLRLPLFRCLAQGVGHFASNDPSCEGQQQEGLYGFVDRGPSPQAGREVVRCVGNADHLITLDRGECLRSGYQIEAILGFVP